MPSCLSPCGKQAAQLQALDSITRKLKYHTIKLPRVEIREAGGGENELIANKVRENEKTR